MSGNPSLTDPLPPEWSLLEWLVEGGVPWVSVWMSGNPSLTDPLPPEWSVLEWLVEGGVPWVSVWMSLLVFCDLLPVLIQPSQRDKIKPSHLTAARS
jgi:hypothetical protein